MSWEFYSLNVSNKEITIALKIIEKVCKSYNYETFINIKDTL